MQWPVDLQPPIALDTATTGIKTGPASTQGFNTNGPEASRMVMDGTFSHVGMWVETPINTAVAPHQPWLVYRPWPLVDQIPRYQPLLGDRPPPLFEHTIVVIVVRHTSTVCGEGLTS
jgi:hypothetical protein